ncbi:MAG: LEA type 2 family protein [Methanomicrobiales archaeon]
MQSASLAEIGLLVSLTLDNGNPVPITVESIDFEIFEGGSGRERLVAHGHHGEHRMPPGQSVIRIPVTVHNREVIGSLSDLLANRSLDLRITGTARVDLAIISCPVPFSDERRFSF